MLRENETEVPAYLQEAFAKTSRFQDIVSQEHITGPRTGNEILKTCLERAQQGGNRCDALLSSIGYFGHSAGQWSALWDMQQGIGEYGDFPLHKKQPATLELKPNRKLSEGGGGQRVRFSAEETVAFTEGKLSYLYPGREKNLRNLKQNR